MARTWALNAVVLQAMVATTTPTQTRKKPTSSNTYIARATASLCIARYGRVAPPTTTMPG